MTQSMLAEGDLAPGLENMLNQVPREANTGFVLRKLTYSRLVPPCTSFVATYRLDGRHQGWICADGDATASTPTTRSYTRINDDGAGGSAAAHNTYVLHEGDGIVGAIIRVFDGRNETQRTGNMIAGIVPVMQREAETSAGGSATQNAEIRVYGTFSNPHTTILSENIGGYASQSAAGGGIIGVYDHARHVSNIKTFDGDTASGSYADSLADPVLGVAVEGISDKADAAKIRIYLDVYALVGTRAYRHAPAPRTKGSLNILRKMEVCIHPDIVSSPDYNSDDDAEHTTMNPAFSI